MVRSYIHCSLCQAKGVNCTNCPYNPNAKNHYPRKHRKIKQTGGNQSENRRLINTYRVGDHLIPLTIEDIRSRFWNPKTKKYKKIEYFSPQSSANRLLITDIKPASDGTHMFHVLEEYNDPKERQMKHVLSLPDYFTPNGDLIIGLCDREIEHNWLQSGKAGPYGLWQTMPYYFLGGELSNRNSSAQVCSGPRNVISHDCLDEITFWVK